MGEVDDGIITKDGNVVKISPEDNVLATKNEIQTSAPTSAGSEGGGGMLGKLSDAVSTAASFTPMGMAANAIGGLFGGGGDSGTSTDAQAAAIEKLNSILEAGIMATVSADQAASAVNSANSYRTS